MNHNVNECLDRYIHDIPMKFSDRFLSTTIDETSLMAYDEIEDLSRFHVSDYKFDDELFAIETFEIQQRSLQAEKQREEEQKKCEEEDAARRTQEEQAKEPKANFFLRQMVKTGEILQPQPMYKHPGTELAGNAHSTTLNCDQTMLNQNGQSSTQKSALVNGIKAINPTDFDYQASSPFDDLELKTIDERQELNNLFRSMNVANAPSNSSTPTPTSSVPEPALTPTPSSTFSGTIAGPGPTYNVAGSWRPPLTSSSSNVIPSSSSYAASLPSSSVSNASITQIHPTNPFYSNIHQPLQYPSPVPTPPSTLTMNHQPIPNSQAQYYQQQSNYSHGQTGGANSQIYPHVGYNNLNNMNNYPQNYSNYGYAPAVHYPFPQATNNINNSYQHPNSTSSNQNSAPPPENGQPKHQ